MLAAAVCGAHAMEILTFDSHGSCIEVVQDFDIAASRDSCSLPHVGGACRREIKTSHITLHAHIVLFFDNPSLPGTHTRIKASLVVA